MSGDDVKPTVAAELLADSLTKTADKQSDELMSQMAGGLAHLIIGLDKQQQISCHAAEKISDIEEKFAKFEVQCQSCRGEIARLQEEKRFAKKLLVIGGSIMTGLMAIAGGLVGTVKTIHDDQTAKIAEEVYAKHQTLSIITPPTLKKP